MKAKALFGFLIISMVIVSCGGDNETGGPGSDTAVNCSNLQAGAGASTATTRDQFVDHVLNNRFTGDSREGTYAIAMSEYVITSTSQLNQTLRSSGLTVNCNYGYIPDFSEIGLRRVVNNGTIDRRVSICGQNYNFSSDEEFGGSLCSLKERLVTVMRNATRVRTCGGTYYSDLSSQYIADYYNNCVEVSNNSNDGYYNYGGYSSNAATSVMIFTYGGKDYTVDLRKPLAANPVFVRPTNGSSTTTSSNTYNGGYTDFNF